MRDVARHARVSVATVSRVLNGAPNVSVETRSRVEQAIATLRFVPSSAARAINSGRTRLVGALIPTMDHDIFARFVDALEDGLDEHNLSLIIASTHYDSNRELDRAQKLLNIGVEGLIVSGVTRDADFDTLIAKHQVPVIATSLFDANYTYPTIGYDNPGVATLALSHLTDLGHRHIAALSGPLSPNDRNRARVDGLLQNADGATVHVVETALDFASAASAVESVLAAHPQITAILCLTDVLAQGVLTYLKATGHKVPHDISVTGIDDLPNAMSFDPPLTTVRLPVLDMGRRTAQALTRWIEDGTPAMSECLQSEFIERQSTAPPQK